MDTFYRKAYDTDGMDLEPVDPYSLVNLVKFIKATTGCSLKDAHSLAKQWQSDLDERKLKAAILKVTDFECMAMRLRDLVDAGQYNEALEMIRQFKREV